MAQVADSLPPILAMEKEKEVKGCWDENTFQLWLSGAPRSFSIFGWLCMPHIGVYGEDYTPTLPFCSINFKPSKSQLPPSVAEALKDGFESLDLFFNVHPVVPPQPCQKFICDNFDEFNMMYHAWLYPSADITEAGLELAENVAMGIFEPIGVQSIHLDLKDAGIPFNSLETRTVTIHNGCFSPQNAQMQFCHDAPFATFWSVAASKSRAVASFHVVCQEESAEKALAEAIGKCSTLGELLAALRSKGPAEAAKALSMLLEIEN